MPNVSGVQQIAGAAPVAVPHHEHKLCTALQIAAPRKPSPRAHPATIRMFSVMLLAAAAQQSAVHAFDRQHSGRGCKLAGRGLQLHRTGCGRTPAENAAGRSGSQSVELALALRSHRYLVQQVESCVCVCVCVCVLWVWVGGRSSCSGSAPSVVQLPSPALWPPALSLPFVGFAVRRTGAPPTVSLPSSSIFTSSPSRQP